MPQRKTNRGQIIDFDNLIEKQGNQPALGNMQVDAHGNRLGPNGEIVERAEYRARKHYQAPSGPAKPTSLKADQFSDDPAGAERPSKVNVKKKAPSKPSDVNQTQVDEEIRRAKAKMKEMAAEGKEPVGQKEVQLPDGSIEVIPIYEDDDFDGGNID
jgi:hypothetical protein